MVKKKRIKKKSKRDKKPRRKRILKDKGLNAILLFVLLFVVYLTLKSFIIPETAIIQIVDKRCDDCFVLTAVVDEIKGQGLSFEKEEVLDYKSLRAKQLIQNYGIENVPSIVLLGVEAELEDFRQVGDALVFDSPDIPYTEVRTGKIRGYISVIYIIESSCDDCYNVSKVVEGMRSVGVRIPYEKRIELSSKQGKELVEKYNIEKVPTIILDQEVDFYDNIRGGWFVYGSVEDDAYVMRNVTPPYYSVKDGKVQGYVDVVFLTDSSCSECYDVGLHEQLLEQVEIRFGNTESIDVSELDGVELVKKYGITEVPTIIISKEASEYYMASYTLDNFYSAEDDGKFVFRNFNKWKGVTYKDISSGEIKTSRR